MKLPIDIMKVISKKGIDSDTPYKGVVIDSNDPDKLLRVQVRVPILHDGIEDRYLPWAIPEDAAHPRGLVGGGLGRTARLMGIPTRGAYVSVFFRHAGDPNLASYTHNLPITSDSIPEEFLNGYPDTHGVIYPSGMFHLHNERTNEVFLNLPGDCHVTIFGDCHQTVIGNYQVTVAKSTAAIPSYLKSSISSILSSLQPDPKTRVPFKGLGKKDAGNLHLEIEGDFTSNTQGNVIHTVAGNMEYNVKGDMDVNVDGNYKENGRRIDMN